MSPRIRILHTGGTLGMRPREPDRALAPDEFGATVLEHVPELRRLADIDTRVLFNLDSCDLTPEHWMTLAREVRRAGDAGDSGDSIDGVVITHGTDAMAYTAAALSYVLRGLTLPVILTGSQRPLADLKTDGRANLIGAVDLATRGIDEVGIYFDGLLLRGNRTTKVSSFAFGAFASPGLQPLVEVGADVRIVQPHWRGEGPFRVEGAFDPRVVALRLAPGQPLAVARAIVDAGARGLLLVGFGTGNVPVERPDLTDWIAELTAAGVVVAIGSQASHGRVDLARYAGGRAAAAAGAVGIADMTLDAAVVKLMYLLGTLDDADAVRRALTEPLAGEVSPPDVHDGPGGPTGRS